MNRQRISSPTRKQAAQRVYQEKIRDQRRQWNAEWIRNNRDRYNASKARYRLKIKMSALKMYSDPPQCAHCGFKKLDSLVLDHINDDGAKHRRESKIAGRGSGVGTTIYEYLHRTGKMEGLQVLCANCNMAKELRRKRRESIKDHELFREIEALYGHQNS
jgi:5-methylcytosine-specific restriction endonuclease McrA